MSYDVVLTSNMKQVIGDRGFLLVAECDNYVAIRLEQAQSVSLLDIQFFQDNGLHLRAIDRPIVFLEKINRK